MSTFTTPFESAGGSPVHECRLENGLTVLVRECRAAPVVSCWVGYRVGARNERSGFTGASHWVEHMTFKGTRALGPGEIFRLTARHGGANNGFTSDDFTCYYETLPADCLDLALFIEAERMYHTRFDEQETERERTVILSEREGAENSPQYLLAERLGAEVFRIHPYGQPILGTRSDLLQLTPARLREHYERHYSPANAVLVIAGAVAPGEAIATIRRRFAAPGHLLQPKPEPAPEPDQHGERRVELIHPGATAHLVAAWRTPQGSDHDVYALLVADAILSGARGLSWNSAGYLGRGARLYRALVESRLALSAGSSFRRMLDPYVFSASLSLRAGADPQAAEEALVSTVEGLARHPPTRDELERTRSQLRAQMAYSRDGVTSQAYALLQAQLHGHWSDLERLVPRLEAVSADDVARVAALYLVSSRRTVGWHRPNGEAKRTLATQIPPGRTAAVTAPPHAAGGTTPGWRKAGSSTERRPTLEPAREQLDNGTTLLYAQRSETHAVSVRASFPAGSARESAGTAGLAALTAATLRRGAAGRTALEIADAVERLGGSFSVWAGTEEAGFSVKCLGRDLEAVLDVVRDVMTRPAFAPEELEKTRGEALNALRELEDSSRAQVNRVMMTALYPPGHPYARLVAGTEESLRALDSRDLRAFHEAYYGAHGMRVAAAGAIQPDSLKRHLSRWFTARDAPPPMPALRVCARGAPEGSAMQVISMPHKTQADVGLAGPAISRDDPDYYALSMITLILGGLGLMGRLGERVRDREGLAYGVSCRAACRLWGGEWHAGAGVGPANVERAVAAIRAEVEQVREVLVTPEELEDAQDYLIGSLPLRMESNEGTAAYLLNCEYYGLGLDYLWRFPDIIRRLDRHALRAAAQRYLDPSTAHVAVAGPV